MSGMLPEDEDGELRPWSMRMLVEACSLAIEQALLKKGSIAPSRTEKVFRASIWQGTLAVLRHSDTL